MPDPIILDQPLPVSSCLQVSRRAAVVLLLRVRGPILGFISLPAPSPCSPSSYHCQHQLLNTFQHSPLETLQLAGDCSVSASVTDNWIKSSQTYQSEGWGITYNRARVRVRCTEFTFFYPANKILSIYLQSGYEREVVTQIRVDIDAGKVADVRSKALAVNNIYQLIISSGNTNTTRSRAATTIYFVCPAAVLSQLTGSQTLDRNNISSYRYLHCI